MTIIEALKISDRVKREGWKGKYKWINFKEDGIVYPIHLTKEEILATDWQPYEQEKVKCEACKEADEFEKGNLSDFAGTHLIRNHLRKYHCQCKGDK